MVDLIRVISERVREEDIRVVRFCGLVVEVSRKLLESERENICLEEDDEIVVD